MARATVVGRLPSCVLARLLPHRHIDHMKTSSYVRRVRPGRQHRAGGAPEALPGDTCDVDVIHLDAVRAARAALPSAGGLNRVADLLALLTNPTRLRMVLGLRAGARTSDQGELCVCDLAAVAGASKSMTSHQLRLLRAARLVVPRRAGKLTYYRLSDPSIIALLEDALRVALVLP
jgi:DNA-binding transcriptional ArsR family regulator